MVSRIFALRVLACLALAGCGDYGKVEQGRVVAYDKDKKEVTFLPNSEANPAKAPKYAVPAKTFAIPADPQEMGKEPKGGMLRVNINVDKKIITMYNPKTQAFEDLSFELVENHQNVNVRRQNPLVWDAATRKAKVFPQSDDAKKTVTVYSMRQQQLTVMKFADADYAKYKGDQWGAGDEIRIYYKVDKKASRLMNVTQTDIMRRR